MAELTWHVRFKDGPLEGATADVAGELPPTIDAAGWTYVRWDVDPDADGIPKLMHSPTGEVVYKWDSSSERYR